MNQPIHDPLGDDVALAFVMTTKDQRIAVADKWTLRFPYADLLNISPDGLLIASLLEAEHPAIVDERSRPKAKEFGAMLKLALAYSSVDK